MIIDCHTHVGRGVKLDDMYQIDCTVERVEYLMDKASVDKSILFPVYYPDYRQPNREIAQTVRENKRFMGFARINCLAPDAPDQIEYAVKELGLVGLKLHPWDGFPTREIMDKARALRIPVLFHAGIGEHPPIQFEGLIKSYPDVTLIMAHLGIDINSAKMFEYSAQSCYMARKYKNLYLDTAATNWISYFLEVAVEEAGPDKILFGTDSPWFHPTITIAFINDLEIGDSDKAKILGGNIARILNL